MRCPDAKTCSLNNWWDCSLVLWGVSTPASRGRCWQHRCLCRGAQDLFPPSNTIQSIMVLLFVFHLSKGVWGLPECTKTVERVLKGKAKQIVGTVGTGNLRLGKLRCTKINRSVPYSLLETGLLCVSPNYFCLHWWCQRSMRRRKPHMQENTHTHTKRTCRTGRWAGHRWRKQTSQTTLMRNMTSLPGGLFLHFTCKLVLFFFP